MAFVQFIIIDYILGDNWVTKLTNQYNTKIKGEDYIWEIAPSARGRNDVGSISCNLLFIS